MAPSPLGHSTHTAQHAAIPKGQGPELVQDMTPALSPVSQGQTLHLARATGSEVSSNEQKQTIPLKLKGFRWKWLSLELWSQPLRSSHQYPCEEERKMARRHVNGSMAPGLDVAL